MKDKPETKSTRIYDGKVVNLRIDAFHLPDGREAKMEIVEHVDVVHILPVNDDGNLLLVRQYRAAAGMELLETPAGGIEPGEDIEAAAQRELQRGDRLPGRKLQVARLGLQLSRLLHRAQPPLPGHGPLLRPA